MSKLFLVLALALACVAIVQCGTYVRLQKFSSTDCRGEGLALEWYNGTTCTRIDSIYHNIFCSENGTPYGVDCTGSCLGSCRSIGNSEVTWDEMYCWALNNVNGYGITCFRNGTSPSVGEPIVSSPRSSTPVVSTPTSTPTPTTTPTTTPSTSPSTNPTSTNPPPTTSPSGQTPTVSPTGNSPKNSSAQSMFSVNASFAIVTIAFIVLAAI